MASRRQWHLSVLSAIVGAALLAACGGGDSGPSTTRVVSFGDSLSDLGTYAPATSLAGTGAAPFFGGRFTSNTHTGYTAASNSNTATIWVEWVAARLGVAITQAAVGFATTNIPCPAAANPALASSCTAYGQGGSRVTDPNGIGKTGGALTVPVVTQMANHLTRFTSYGAGDIVFVWAGSNDMLIQFGAVAQGLPPATAVANMQLAATQLATLIKDQVVAKGATRVAVMNVPDGSIAPAFSALPAANKALLTQLSAEFNSTLTTSLAGVDVRMIDIRAFIGDAIANPAKYAFTNATVAACDPAKIAGVTGGRVTDGSSLFCNAASGQPFNGLKTGASASTWLFADGVHPTSGGHKAISDFVIGKLKEFGWMPINQ